MGSPEDIRPAVSSFELTSVQKTYQETAGILILKDRKSSDGSDQRQPYHDPKFRNGVLERISYPPRSFEGSLSTDLVLGHFGNEHFPPARLLSAPVRNMVEGWGEKTVYDSDTFYYAHLRSKGVHIAEARVSYPGSLYFQAGIKVVHGRTLAESSERLAAVCKALEASIMGNVAYLEGLSHELYIRERVAFLTGTGLPR